MGPDPPVPAWPGLDRDELLVFADELMRHGDPPERVHGAQMAALLGAGATPGKVRARWALWKLGRHPGVERLLLDVFRCQGRQLEAAFEMRSSGIAEQIGIAADFDTAITEMTADAEVIVGFSRASRRQRFPRPASVRMSSQVPRRTPRRQGIGRRET